jgi:hypothetical protein
VKSASNLASFDAAFYILRSRAKQGPNSASPCPLRGEPRPPRFANAFALIFLDAIESSLLQIPSQYTTFHYLVIKHIRADIEESSLHNSDADWANLEGTERHVSAN